MELDRTVDPTGEDVVMELASGATVVVDKVSS
jgi:hypothetical protein